MSKRGSSSSYSKHKKPNNGKKELLNNVVIPMENDFIDGKTTEDGTSIIDGSSLEGGGQILRSSVALCALLGKPLKVVNIRAKRDRPGLKPQHLHGILLVRDMFRAYLNGHVVNSSEIFFKPDSFSSKHEYIADTQTAGSITLLFQISLPCAIFAPQPLKLILKGGTNAEAAPQIDFTTMVFQPIAEKFGFHFDLDIVRRGYYPRGGGVVEIRTQPVEVLKPITLVDKGEVIRVYGRTFVSGTLPITIADRISRVAEKMVKRFLNRSETIEFNFELVQEDPKIATGNGTGIIIVATTSTGCILAGSALGEVKKSSESVGEEAAQMLIDNLQYGGCVDEHLQDQLIIFMALAKGKSTIRTGPLTLHTKTSIHFAQCLTGANFTVTPVEQNSKEEEGVSASFIIECEGIGFVNQSLSSVNQKE